MGACTCTYTRDEEKNCDGTHKVVKAVKAEMAEKLEANGFPHAAEYVKNNQFLHSRKLRKEGTNRMKFPKVPR